MDFEALRTISDETEQIRQTYTLFREETRLFASKAAQVEFLTTVHYIERYLPAGGRLLDIGAGAGAYSLYFARKGYTVEALELSPANVEAFRRQLRAEDPVTLRQGDARELSVYADNSFDAVLLCGPLYHLHREEDRQRCIAEARRVCKPGGALFFAFIQNDMVILTEFAYNAAYFSGNSYDHETFKVEDFPFVFFTLDQCRDMLRRGGIAIRHEVASDGVSELMADRINALNEEDYRQFLRYHWYTCEKPEMLGHSNHLLFIGTKS